jgi:serine/threonine-protein kinase
VPEVGTQLAGYRIEGVLGRGGMGVVYRATELALDRPVALKLIAPELAGDASFRERFLRESRLAASIDHAGILPVYAAGDAGGELYLANRFVDGTDLRAVLADGPLAPERALALVGQVADALDAAHARGLVHRDVKPGNVLVDAVDHCYLSDFGLTTRLGADGTTATGRLAGSLDYLAPEQIRRDTVDARTDQYALACVLYELLSGAPPFRRETEAQTLWAHMQEDTPTLTGHPQLDPVLARALAKTKDDRYETCNAFVDDARAALGLAPSPVALRRRRRLVGRRLLVAGAASVAVAVGAVALVLALGSGEALVAPANSVGAVDPVSRELVRAVPVGNTPTEVAASY